MQFDNPIGVIVFFALFQALSHVPIPSIATTNYVQEKRAGKVEEG